MKTNPRDESPCEKCGVVFGIGDWPWCPHGKFRQLRGDFPAFWDDQLAPPGEPPVYVDSMGTLEKHMRRHGLEARDPVHLADLNQRRWKLGMPELRK